jgi:ribosome biogenesis protein Tsr3
MAFAFAPDIQAGLSSGNYEVVKNNAGKALGVAMNKATGQFVGHAIGMTANALPGMEHLADITVVDHLADFSVGISVDVIPQLGQMAGAIANPVTALPQLAMGAAQMVQTHQGFQKTYRMIDTLQNSVGVLQATTAVIGVTSVVGVALSAANLYQVMKLRKEVAEFRHEVQEGFLQVLEEVRGIPDQIEFRNHRTILVMAYGQFMEATRLMKLAMPIEDPSARQTTLGNAQNFLANALNAYNQPELFRETCAAGQLRRLECAWMMEQAQAFNFLLMNAPQAASHALEHLQERVRRESLQIIDRCQSEEELDFLFPEITRIQTHDLPVLKAWQNQVDWVQTLSAEAKEQLASLQTAEETEQTEGENELVEVIEPEEFAFYNKLKQKSHYPALQDQLRFIVQPKLRQGHEQYISQQAMKTGQKGLASPNWEEVTDLTVANLYHYFKVREGGVSLA